jgi:hypothetical protein
MGSLHSKSGQITENSANTLIAEGHAQSHSISFDQLIPVFLSTPKSNHEITLPFTFGGGLGFTSKTIGSMLAIQGVYSMIAQLWLFPLVVRHLGALRTFRLVLIIWSPLYLLVPYMIILSETLHMVAAFAALICKITFHVIAFPSSAILLAHAAPSPNVLGSINGAAASVASLSRALGPSVTGLLHSRGLDSGYSIISWWACGIVCSIGAVLSFTMEDSDPQTDRDQPFEDGAHYVGRKLAQGSILSEDMENGSFQELQGLLSSARTSVDDSTCPV